MAQYLEPFRTFRDTLEAIVPPWLKGPLGLRYLYGHGTTLDAFGDALLSAVQTRFPGYYSDESLPLIGKERRILRGLNESDYNYADRLITWLTDHAHRGSALAMLHQLYLHYKPNNFVMQLIARNGLTYQMDAAGTVTRYITPGFNPDATPDKWGQWWLLFYTDNWTPPLTDAEIADIRAIPAAWNAAHCLGTILIFPSDAELFDSFPPALFDDGATFDSAGVPMVITVNTN